MTCGFLFEIIICNLDSRLCSCGSKEGEGGEEVKRRKGGVESKNEGGVGVGGGRRRRRRKRKRRRRRREKMKKSIKR